MASWTPINSTAVRQVCIAIGVTSSDIGSSVSTCVSVRMSIRLRRSFASSSDSSSALPASSPASSASSIARRRSPHESFSLRIVGPMTFLKCFRTLRYCALSHKLLTADKLTPSSDAVSFSSVYSFRIFASTFSYALRIELSGIVEIIVSIWRTPIWLMPSASTKQNSAGRFGTSAAKLRIAFNTNAASTALPAPGAWPITTLIES